MYYETELKAVERATRLKLDGPFYKEIEDKETDFITAIPVFVIKKEKSFRKRRKKCFLAIVRKDKKND